VTACGFGKGLADEGDGEEEPAERIASPLHEVSSEMK
jgi:hypothetical protein